MKKNDFGIFVNLVGHLIQLNSFLFKKKSVKQIQFNGRETKYTNHGQSRSGGVRNLPHTIMTTKRVIIKK